MSTNMEMTSSPDKAALATVLNYLRNKNLKDTEEALKKELSVLGQSDYPDLPAHSLAVSSLGQSGTEPSKYEESYASYPSSTPSTSTMTDIQSATTEDSIAHSRTSSISSDDEEDEPSQENENHFDSEQTTLEVSSSNPPPPNLVQDHTVASSWPKGVPIKPNHLKISPFTSSIPIVSPPQTVIHIGASALTPTAEAVTSPPAESNSNQYLISTNLERSNSEPSPTKTQLSSPQQTVTAQLPVGGPLLYQVATTGQNIGGLPRQILTPILTVLPSSNLVNPLSATTLQAGGQPIIFNTTTSTQAAQVISQASLMMPEGSDSIVTNGKVVFPAQSKPHSKSDSPTRHSLTSPVETMQISSGVPSPPRTLASLMLSEMTPQYLELKAFAEKFKTKRIRLGYTQGAVGQSLARKGYNNFAQSTISRFEQMQLSPTNAAAIKQVLEKWLHDAECPDSQSSLSVSSSTSAFPMMNSRKRKKRAVFTSQTRTSLDEFFKQNSRPNRQLIENIADELNLLPEEVRVWFCNKRQKTKQPHHNMQTVYQCSFDRESSLSTSSFADSPTSLYDKGRSPSPKTPFTIEELSKSSSSMTTSPCQSTSPVHFSSLGMVRPLASAGLYPVVISSGQATMCSSPPRLIHSPPVAQTTA